MSLPAETPWWQYHDTVWTVASWAVELDRLTDRAHLLHYFEKPYHYDDLYEDWRTWVALERAGIIDENGSLPIHGADNVRVRDDRQDIYLGVDEGYGRPDCHCGATATVLLPPAGPLCYRHLTDHLKAAAR
jgi:hypothetical protein